MPRVKFITAGHSHMAGNFSAGDTYTGDEAVCRHFVEDARCAVWDNVQEVQAPGQQPDGAPTREELDAALAALPGDHVDPAYVLRAMRSHFGDLFTDDDASRVCELVKAPAAADKPAADKPAETDKPARRRS